MVNRNVLPWPNWLSTQMVPLYVWMMLFTLAKPTPLPATALAAALLPRRFDARQFEQFADQVRLHFHVFLDALEPVRDVFVEVLAMLAEQHARHAGDVSQRRVQVMRHRAQEIFLLGDLRAKPMVRRR